MDVINTPSIPTDTASSYISATGCAPPPMELGDADRTTQYLQFGGTKVKGYPIDLACDLNADGTLTPADLALLFREWFGLENSPETVVPTPNGNILLTFQETVYANAMGYEAKIRGTVGESSAVEGVSIIPIFLKVKTGDTPRIKDLVGSDLSMPWTLLDGDGEYDIGMYILARFAPSTNLPDTILEIITTHPIQIADEYMATVGTVNGGDVALDSLMLHPNTQFVFLPQITKPYGVTNSDQSQGIVFLPSESLLGLIGLIRQGLNRRNKGRKARGSPHFTATTLSALLGRTPTSINNLIAIIRGILESNSQI